MTSQSPFAGGDQSYLRDVQYRDGTKLDIRATLHQRFSTSELLFPDFEAGLIEWRADLAVIECGTGTGRFWDNVVAPRSISLTLTDLSPGMVQLAVDRAGENAFERVEGRECDVQDLPFDDDSFDLAIANHMLYHAPDPDRAVAELSRVLRPDGTLLAATNGYGHMKEMNEAIAEVFGRGNEGLYEVFGIDTGEARLRERFGSITWHAFDNDLMVDDPAAAIAYGLSFPPGETATDEEAAAFARAIGRRFVDGRMHIRTRAGAFVCSAPRSRV
mgnify:CR=1 FL=1